MKTWFVINNIDDFTDKTRILVYNNFGIWNKEDSSIEASSFAELNASQSEELNDILSHDEALLIITSIVKKQKHKITNTSRFILNESIFVDLIKSLNDRMTSNILQNLVKKGLIETSYDSEVDDFIFWIKDNENNSENKDKNKRQTD